MSNLFPKKQNGLRYDNLDPKIYSLISIGQRGSGKTVFLASSYAQFRFEPTHDSLRSVWLECKDPESQDNIINLLNYIKRTGEYPPATLKITNFDFSIQQEFSGIKKTIGRVCWWDIPGESCKIYNPAFLTMVISAQGCCLFLDAQSLVNKSGNAQELKALIDPIQIIAEILHQNNIKHPLALIVTKCDLLEAKTVRWQLLHKNLSPLICYLNDLNINYQTFYSEIPIKQLQADIPFAKSSTSQPLMWLVQEMQKADIVFLAEETTDSSLQTAKPTEVITTQFQQIFSFIRSKSLAILSFIFLFGLVGLISQMLLFSQNSRLIIPEQKNTQPLNPER